MTLFEAFHANAAAELTRLLDTGADIHAADEHGWTLLHWAAGRGDLALVTRLVASGADVFARGRDARTPYLIAFAAGHRETVLALQEAEAARGGDTERISSRLGERRTYCRAYPLGALRSFPAWTEADGSTDPRPGDDDVVFLHQDYVVTRSIVRDEPAIFTAATPEWRTFCADTLHFVAPTDLDLIVAPPPRGA